MNILTHESENIKKARIISAVIGGAVYLLTNGYRFFQASFSGDSLLMVYQNDAAWQIALGRFVQPFLILLRGSITAPLLVSSLSLLWLMLSVYLVTDFLDIKKTVSLVLTGAVMASSPALIAANTSYLPWVDFYCFSLFLAVLGARLLNGTKKYQFVIAVVALAVSVGTYQAYICVTAGLLMLRLLSRLLKEKVDYRKILVSDCLKWAAGLSLSAVVYYVPWKLIQNYRHIWTSNTYNGLDGLGNYSGLSVPGLVGYTYERVFDFLIHPMTYITISFEGRNLSLLLGNLLGIINIIAIFIALVFLVIRNIRIKTPLSSKILQGLLLLLYPFGINVVCFLSKGMEHTLMMYGLTMIPIFEIYCFDGWASAEEGTEKPAKLQRICPAVCGVLMVVFISAVTWSQCVCGNQISLKKNLQEKAAQSLMTRILSRVETTEGYIPGVTPVAFSGSFIDNPHIREIVGLEDIDIYGSRITTLSYLGTDYAYLNYYEQTDINLTRIPFEDERLKAIPCFPEEGSLVFLDDVLVVKIADY